MEELKYIKNYRKEKIDSTNKTSEIMTNNDKTNKTTLKHDMIKKKKK